MVITNYSLYEKIVQCNVQEISKLELHFYISYKSNVSYNLNIDMIQ